MLSDVAGLIGVGHLAALQLSGSPGAVAWRLPAPGMARPLEQGWPFLFCLFDEIIYRCATVLSVADHWRLAVCIEHGQGLAISIKGIFDAGRQPVGEKVNAFLGHPGLAQGL